MNEENDIIAEYSPKSEFSKASIVQQAVLKVIDARGQEMKEGYFNNKITPEGEIVKTWIPDTRKIFIGSVEALRSVLEPEIKDSKETTEVITKFTRIKKKIFDKYSVKKFEIQENKIIGTVDDPYLPEIDEQVPREVYKETNTFRKYEIQYVVGFWNSKVNLYWNELLELYDFLFAELNCLIHSLNYFKSAPSF